MTCLEHLKQIESFMVHFKEDERVMIRLRRDWIEAQKLLEIEKSIFGDNLETIKGKDE
jgi:hypothetical protein